jgi:hypothetical protein
VLTVAKKPVENARTRRPPRLAWLCELCGLRVLGYGLAEDLDDRGGDGGGGEGVFRAARQWRVDSPESTVDSRLFSLWTLDCGL